MLSVNSGYKQYLFGKVFENFSYGDKAILNSHLDMVEQALNRLYEKLRGKEELRLKGGGCSNYSTLLAKLTKRAETAIEILKRCNNQPMQNISINSNYFSKISTDTN
jgi:chromosome condensin MukBEF ATPase and DNA-binding subunit MukB